MEVTTKVYPSAIIPDKNEIQAAHQIQRKNYRPNNFMNEAPVYAANRYGYNSSLGRGYGGEEDDD